ncbi:MAG: Asp-tRNA(Asn)/Glu-tRNA(Gln) amidotransferase subunit GatA [Saccharofermentanales bacterium]
MSNFDLNTASAVEISRKIKQKDISVKEAAEHIINIKDEQNPQINAYLHFEPEQIISNAEIIQTRINDGGCGSPLAGISVAIKDNICTKGITTTCASKMLENFIPPYSASVIDKLDENCLFLAGKCNMDEFAMGSTTETSYFGQTKNPWNSSYSPGGSSGGSAAAVASGMAFCALGSDTGGSIRQPASFCGITGLKPTYGAVSRFGLIAYASSLDQIGPMARSVEDCAALFDQIQGADLKDSTCITTKASDYHKNLTAFLEKNSDTSNPLKGMRIGIPQEYISEGIHEDVKKSVIEAAKKFENLGAVCETFSMPMVRYAVPVYYILASAEASSNLSRYDGIKYGTRAKNIEDLSELYVKTRTENFGNEVARRILLGSFVLSSGYFDAYYQTALKVKGRIKKEFDAAFMKYDAVISPTSPDTAPKLGESLSDPLKMYLNDIYTVSVNLAGIPAMSIPCGFDSGNMPIGVQLIGNAFKEDILFQIGAVFQQHTDFHLQKPPLSGRQEGKK